jgi:tetratricopeptide (TPR) repeat protein
MQGKEILDSWKEIAFYLRRSERTCRRWEKEFGLPIYRMDGSPRASVFAYKEELARWLDEMLHEEKIPSRKTFLLSRKNLFIILGLAIISLSILAGVFWRLLPREKGVSPLSDKPSLAILHFKNNTGDESLDYWKRALCDLLISDLSQSRYLTVLPEDRLFHILRDLKLLGVEDYTTEDLERFAAKAQVENVLCGNFIKAGETIRINAFIRKISSDEDIVLNSIERKSEEEFFSMMDELSRRIKIKLELSADIVSNDFDEEMEMITTKSIEAYKYYTEGRNHYRKGYGKESLPFLERAVEIDPEFAMAYRLLALSYGNLPGYNDKARYCRRRAFELSHRASERERLLIQAGYYSSQSEKTWDRAIKTFQELLRIYPDDYLGITKLGVIYRYLEDWDKAVETLKKVSHIYYYTAHFAHLRRAFCAQGNYEEAIELAEGIPVEVGPYQIPFQLSYNLFFHGKLDNALLGVEEMLDLNPEFHPAITLRGDIWLCKGDWSRAEEDYKKTLDPKGPDIKWMKYHNRALIRLSSLSLSQGKFERATAPLKQGVEESKALDEEGWLSNFYLKMACAQLKKKDIKGAIRECQNALEIGNVTGRIKALHIKGIISVEANDLNEAQSAADEIRKEVENWLNPKLMRYYHHLRGYIELKRHNIAEAITYFEEATELLPFQYDPDGDEHAPFYEGLALAFYEAGNLERALEWYEEILSLTSGRLLHGDIYAKSFYMLGRIYEQKGWQGKAIENYEKFLDLWKNADQGIPEVEEAKQHLIALQS